MRGKVCLAWSVCRSLFGKVCSAKLGKRCLAKSVWQSLFGCLYVVRARTTAFQSKAKSVWQILFGKVCLANLLGTIWQSLTKCSKIVRVWLHCGSMTHVRGPTETTENPKTCMDPARMILNHNYHMQQWGIVSQSRTQSMWIQHHHNELLDCFG